MSRLCSHVRVQPRSFVHSVWSFGAENYITAHLPFGTVPVAHYSSRTASFPIVCILISLSDVVPLIIGQFRCSRAARQRRAAHALYPMHGSV